MDIDEPLMLTPPPLNGTSYNIHYHTVVTFSSILTTATNDTYIEDSNITIVESSIQVPMEAFPDSEFSFVLNHYATSIFFPLATPEGFNESEYEMVTDTEVIGFTIPEEPNITNLTDPVVIVLQSLRGRNGEVSYLCRSIGGWYYCGTSLRTPYNWDIL